MDSYSCFRLALIHAVLYIFSSIHHLLCTDAQILMLFHLTQMRFSRSTHLLMCLSMETLTYIMTVETDRPGKLCYNCFISNYLTQILNFPTWIPDCDYHSQAFLALFTSSDASICSAMASRPLGNSNHIVDSVFIIFLQY